MCTIAQCFLVISIVFTSAHVVCAQWVQANGPFGGTVFSMAVTGDTLYVATDASVFRSVDDGDTWQPFRKGLPQTGAFNIVANGSVLFVATRDGVYRSVDAGETWVAAGDGICEGLGIGNFAFEGTKVYCVCSQEMYGTTDLGDTWVQQPSEWALNTIVSRGTELYAGGSYGGLFHSIDEEHAVWTQIPLYYGATVNAIAFDGANIIVGTRLQILISSDTGKNWKSGNGLPQVEVSNIFVSPARLLAATSDGVWESLDRGATWSRFKLGIEGLTTTHVAMVGENVFAACSGKSVFRVDTSDNVWESVSNGIAGTWVDALIHQNGKLYASARTDGFWKSLDSGRTWLSVKSPVIDTEPRNPTNLSSLAAFGDTVFAGTEFYGVYRTTNDGSTWQPIGDSLPSQRIGALGRQGANLFLGSAEGGVYFSSDKGDTWKDVTWGVKGRGNFWFYTSESHVFAGSMEAVSVSSDSGASWRVLKEIHPNTMRSIVQFDSILLVGTVSDDVHRSTDMGRSWLKSSAGLHGNVAQLFRYDSTAFAGTDEGIFISRDTGRTWKSVSEDLFTYDVVEITVMGPDMYLGIMDGGVWKRSLAEMGVDMHIDPTPNPTDTSTGPSIKLHPNPSPEFPTIFYSTADPGVVTIDIFDHRGGLVAAALNKHRDAGSYTLQCNTCHVSSGTYYARLKSNGHVLWARGIVIR